MAIRIKIVADYDKKGMTAATRALDDFGKAAQIALGAVAVATAALAAKSVMEFAKFEGAMVQSQAIMGDLSDQMKNEMSDAAREMAKNTTFSAEQAAESYFFLASAGLDAEASIAAMPRVASFAQAGMFDMARATDLLTDAQSALGLTIRDDAVANMENMARVSDVLVKANTLANASVEQFSTALTTKAGAALRAVGKDVEEGVAVLAAFADQGIKGELAGTQLGIVLRDLSTKAINNKAAFEEAGIAVFDSAGEMNNLGDIVADLETSLAGMSDETQKATLLQLGFSDKSLGSLQALLGTSDAIKTYEAELRKAGGTTDEIAEKQLESFNSQLKLLESAVTDVFIEIGEQLTPALKDLVDKVKEVVPEIGEKLVEAIKKVDFAQVVEDFGNFVVLIVDNIDNIAKVAGGLLTAAAALASYRIATGLATTATALFNSTLLLNPIGLFVAAMGAAVGVTLLFPDAVNKSTEGLKGVSYETIKTKYNLKQLTEEQGRLEKQIESSTGYMRDNYQVQLDRTKNEIIKLKYSLSESAGEANRFNNIKLDGIQKELEDTADAARDVEIWDILGAGGGAGGGIGDDEGKEVITSFGKTAAEIRKEIKKLISDQTEALQDAQSDYNKTVLKANTDHAQAVKKLQETYAAKLESIVQQSQNRLRAAYASAVQVSLQSLFERDETKSIDGLVKSLSDRLAASRNLLDRSAQLASAGFTQTFIEQVVGAGVETGNELAQAILDSTPETQKELRDLFRAIEDEAETGMDSLSEQIYEQQGLATRALQALYEQAGQDFQDSLVDQQNRLSEALVNAASAYYDQIVSIKDAFNDQINAMNGKLAGMEDAIENFRKKVGAAEDVALGDVGDAFGDLVENDVVEGISSTVDELTDVVGLIIDNADDVAGVLEYLGQRADLAEAFAARVGDPLQAESALAKALDIREQSAALATAAGGGGAVGTVININVKTDSTQSNAMVGKTLGSIVTKYVTTGGQVLVSPN